MDAEAISRTLDSAETAVRAGEPVAPTGFWRAVAEVKRSPELTEDYADRIARIDRIAFERRVLVRVPVAIGTTLMVLATVGGFVLVALAYYLDGVAAVIAFAAGTAVLLATTHGLGHQVVGSLMGVRFTDWYIGRLSRPQPGVKVDYATYLRVPARRRAWMHASGALVTKAVPFLLIGGAVAAELPAWVPWALAGVGLISVVTDLVWSTKYSDWSRYRREMRFAGSP